jgi:hypothetical protein
MTHLIEPHPWTKPLVVSGYVAGLGAVVMAALAILRHFNIGRMPSMRLSIGLATASATLSMVSCCGVYHLRHPTEDYLGPRGSGQYITRRYDLTYGNQLIYTIVREPGFGQDDEQLARILVTGDGHGIVPGQPRQEMLNRLIAYLNEHPAVTWNPETRWVATKDRKVERAQAAIIHLARGDRTLVCSPRRPMAQGYKPWLQLQRCRETR